jgi:Tir chaperone protein (CesT) family
MHRVTGKQEKFLPDFHELMKELLLFMQIKPFSDAAPEVYSFTFENKTEIKICSRQPGTFDMIVKIGVVQNQKAHTVLLNLLSMNRYISDGPCLSIGIDPDSGIVILWSRQSLAALDLERLKGLLKIVLTRAASARQHLQEVVASSPVKTNTLHQNWMAASTSKVKSTGR